MKILTMGSPATTYIFNQTINETYNGNYEVQRVRNFYTLGHLLSNYENVKQYANTVKQNKKLYDFLNWNFEKGGFWGKLSDFQPDLLVLDLFPEVYFGNVVLEDGTMVTRNFRLTKEVPINATVFNSRNSNYIQEVLKQVSIFEKKVKRISPNTRLIFNGARFPSWMSKNGSIQEKFDKDKYKISDYDITRYNQIWESLDKALIDSGFDVLKFDQKNDAAELNFPTGEHWYYLYNQNYYTDAQSQIEMIAQKYNLGPTVLPLDLDSNIDDLEINQDVVFLDVPNARKDLKIFKQNAKAHQMALKLAKKDYVLHGNKGTFYRFVKRTELKTKFPKFKEVHYRILPPKESKKYWGNRLLVRMMGFSSHHAPSIIERNFQQDFLTLRDSVVKNTYILEIGDINLIAGSFYTNTKNYPDYENQIQELIELVAKKYEIDHNNIVLYGASRGGTGAMLHAALGNYKFVVADPVINDTAWYLDSDSHYVDGVRNIDLTDKICSALDSYHRLKDDGIVISTSNVGVTFSSHLRLPLDKLSLLDTNLRIYEHPPFNGKTVPIQLSYINNLLIKDTIHVIRSIDDLPQGVVIKVKHLAQNAINFKEVSQFRVKISDVEKSEKKVYDLAMENIEGIYNQVGADKQFMYFEEITN